MNREQLAERFWANVAKRGPDDCWLWQSHQSTRGYGQFYAGGGSYRAHRLAITLTQGEIPEGMMACHKCDTPLCCNPAHLFVGTPTENAHDMTRKGRHHGSCLFLTWRGETKSPEEWAKVVGLNAETIRRRKREGLTDEAALTAPRRTSNQHKHRKQANG